MAEWAPLCWIERGLNVRSWELFSRSHNDWYCYYYSTLHYQCVVNPLPIDLIDKNVVIRIGISIYRWHSDEKSLMHYILPIGNNYVVNFNSICAINFLFFSDISMEFHMKISNYHLDYWCHVNLRPHRMHQMMVMPCLGHCSNSGPIVRPPLCDPVDECNRIYCCQSSRPANKFKRK